VPLHSVSDAYDEPGVELTLLAGELHAARQKIANLEVALTTARVISMAVGVLMATFKITDEASFDMLVIASQNTHRKLRDIAQEVVDTGTLNWGRDTEIAPR
jgi:AmiR/NasT family two-component response regulator